MQLQHTDHCPLLSYTREWRVFIKYGRRVTCQKVGDTFDISARAQNAFQYGDSRCSGTDSVFFWRPEASSFVVLFTFWECRWYSSCCYESRILRFCCVVSGPSTHRESCAVPLLGREHSKAQEFLFP